MLIELADVSITLVFAGTIGCVKIRFFGVPELAIPGSPSVLDPAADQCQTVWKVKGVDGANNNQTE